MTDEGKGCGFIEYKVMVIREKLPTFQGEDFGDRYFQVFALRHGRFIPKDNST